MKPWHKFAKRLLLPHYATVDHTRALKQFGVVVTNDSTEVDNWLEKHVYSPSAGTRNDQEGKRVVGFDIEWQADPVQYRGRYQKTDLIQIATPQEVLLFQCRHIHTPSVMLEIHEAVNKDKDIRKSQSDDTSKNLHVPTFPDSMLDLVVSDKIIKAGVGVHDDIQRLGNDFEIDVYFSAYQDVGRASQRIDTINEVSGLQKPNKTSLNYLANHFCGNVQEKKKFIQMSNWGDNTLSAQQIQYAAYDALMGIDIYNVLNQHGLFTAQSRQDFIFYCDSGWKAQLEKVERINAHIKAHPHAQRQMGCDETKTKYFRRLMKRSYKPQIDALDASSSSNASDANADNASTDSLFTRALRFFTGSTAAATISTDSTSKKSAPMVSLAGRAMIKYYYPLMNESLDYLQSIAQIFRQTDQLYLEKAKLGTIEGDAFIYNAESSIIQEHQVAVSDTSNLYRWLLPRLLSRYNRYPTITMVPNNMTSNNKGKEKHRFTAHITTDLFANDTQSGKPGKDACETISLAAPISPPKGNSLSVIATGRGATVALAKEQACRSLFIHILEKEAESKVSDLTWLAYAAGKEDFPVHMKKVFGQRHGRKYTYVFPKKSKSRIALGEWVQRERSLI